MESNALGFPYKNTGQAQALSSRFCSSSPTLCTTATPACDIVAAQQAFMDAQPLSFMSIANLFWAPTVDGTYVIGQPMAAAASLSVPLIAGTNHDEGVPFVYSALDVAPAGSNPPNSVQYASILDQLFGATNGPQIRSVQRYNCNTPCDCTNQLINVMTDFGFTCANRHLATLAAQASNPQPLYLYQFNQVSNFNLWAYTPQPVPQCNALVCHSDELPYVFNSLWTSGCHAAFTPAEQSVANTMAGDWTSFANGHSPGSAWPRFAPANSYLLFSENSSAANDPVNATANCSALWDGIGYETSAMAKTLFNTLRTSRRNAR